MSEKINGLELKQLSEEHITFGISLLSQQIWCWGKDILRSEGNWLIEQGFNIIIAPADQENSQNIYSMKLSENQHIMLRGFGIVYSNSRYGSIFVPRYELLPKYNSSPKVNTLPWDPECLVEFVAPDGIQKQSSLIMLVELINWIISYENNLIKKLGIDYRTTIVDEWDNGKRLVIAPEDVVSEWINLRNDFEDSMKTS